MKLLLWINTIVIPLNLLLSISRATRAKNLPFVWRWDAVVGWSLAWVWFAVSNVLT